MSSTVITRFAPSPTGYLHIGSARTALFNWLYAKHYGGQYLLRIEDTDRERSTQEAVHLILETLTWLGLDHDGEVVYQSHRAHRHAEVAHTLLAQGKAYYCYCTPEELMEMREHAKKNGLPPKYNGFWRDRSSDLAPKGVKPSIRLKMPKEGQTVLNDHVQGNVTLQHEQLDDMVLLRSDGTPTYMLSVVVDDHDMNITHIIRGDDHLTNAFRQMQLYKAMEWSIPEFAHIPLIHGMDGSKLSKRHGALGAETYRDMGFLPETMRNYLLRLGWGHGNEEIISTLKAIELFDLGGVGRSPSRLDITKMTSLNAHYIKHKEDRELLRDALSFVKISPDQKEQERILKGMNGLKQRAKTLVELAEMMQIYITFQEPDDKATSLLNGDFADQIQKLSNHLQKYDDFTHSSLEVVFRTYAETSGRKLGELAQVMRIALTGKTVSPSIFEMMEILGKDETLERLKKILNFCHVQ